MIYNGSLQHQLWNSTKGLSALEIQRTQSKAKARAHCSVPCESISGSWRVHWKPGGDEGEELLRKRSENFFFPLRELA